MDDDEADFRAFVTNRWSSLVTTAFLITRDRGTAEDCVQEALTRCTGAGDGYAGKASPPPTRIGRW